MHIGTTRSGKELTLPEDVVTQTIAILARRGQGKTYMARGLAEQMGSAVRRVGPSRSLVGAS